MNTRQEDLQQRLITFSLEIISLFKYIPRSVENLIIQKQLIRSATSIGANYSEALYAHSRVEFVHVVNICRKEASETRYWLQLLHSINPAHKKDISILTEEAESLLKIFVASVKTAKLNSNKL